MSKTILSYSTIFLYLFFCIISNNTQTNSFVFSTIFVAMLSACGYFLHKLFKDSEDCALYVCLGFVALLYPFRSIAIVPMLISVTILFRNPEFRNNFLKKFDTIDYAWLIFVGFCVVHSIFVPKFDKLSAIGVSFAFLGYGILFKSARYLHIPKQITKTLMMLFGSALIISITFALFHLYSKQDIILPFGFTLYSKGGVGLASLLGSWPAINAGFLVMVFAIIFYQVFFVDYTKKERIFFIFTLLVVSLGILATESRMAFLFMGGFLGAFVLWYPFQKFKKLRFGVLLLPILILPVLVQYSDKWQDTFENPFQQRTIAIRLHQYQHGLELFQENPISGIGILNFKKSFEEYTSTNNIQTMLVYFLHNIYLSFLAETGFIGFLLLMLNIGILLKTFIQRLPLPKAFLGIYFLCGLLCINLVDIWIFVLKLNMTMFPVLGYLYQSKDSLDD